MTHDLCPAQVFEMRLASKELKGGFKTDLLFYQSVQWIMKDRFGAARLTREVTDGWTQRRFEHGGHRFNMDAPELSQQEIDSIPGAQASLGNFDSMKFEMLERINDRMCIKADEHRPLGTLLDRSMLPHSPISQYIYIYMK